MIEMKAQALRRLRQADLTRAVKALKAAGVEIVSTEISPDSTVRLIHTYTHVEDFNRDGSNDNNTEFDQWLASGKLG